MAACTRRLTIWRLSRRLPAQLFASSGSDVPKPWWAASLSMKPDRIGVDATPVRGCFSTTTDHSSLPIIDFKSLADAVGSNYLAGDAATLECVDHATRSTGVTLIAVAVRDSASVVAAAARSRAKAVARSALGSRSEVL